MDRMGLFASDGSPKIDRLIEDTERAIVNTRSFLENFTKAKIRPAATSRS